jgi:predicted ATPase
VARELGEQLLDLAQKEQDPALLLEAYQTLGNTLFHLGEIGAAQAHMEQSLTLYDAQRHRSPVFPYGIEPGVGGLLVVARALWHLGYPDQTFQKNEAARTLAQGGSSPFSLCLALLYTAWLHQLRREGQMAQEWAEAAITLAREHGFPQWLVGGAVLQGWARAEQGQVEEGISQIRQGLATHQAIGSSIYQSYFFALLAEAYGKAGQAEDGLAALAEALTVVDKSEERFYEAELYRLKGELTLQQKSEEQRVRIETSSELPTPSTQAEIEICFCKAIVIARQQQAKSLELRAATSLARLWRRQGKTAEARQMLAEIYGWFTEGFDTKDLQEAKALLEELH